jgi:hypothetical protein
MAVKQNLKLHESILAVHEVHCADDDITRVVTSIPAGQIVQFDRTSPLVGRMRQVEWRGEIYVVFDEDLQNRTEQFSARREDNPGIVAAHSA